MMDGDVTHDLARASIDVVIVAPGKPDIEQMQHALLEAGVLAARSDEPDGIAHAVVTGRPRVVLVDLRGADKIAERMLRWVCGHRRAAVLTITDHDQVDARLQALDLDASDHMVAPIFAREAVARIEALLVREGGTSDAIEAGDLTLHPGQRSVERGGEHVPLTPREVALLQVLVQCANEPVAKHELLKFVWGEQTRTENVVEANVSSLRRKLHRLGPPIIHTVHRGGYIFRPAPRSTLARRDALLAERNH
jgi:DNA-binding response OmpR family regulator